MATNEIENGCGLSTEAVLASNHKRRCVLGQHRPHPAFISASAPTVSASLSPGEREVPLNRNGKAHNRVCRRFTMPDASFGSVATLQSPRGRLAECSWHLRFVVYSSGDNLNR